MSDDGRTDERLVGAIDIGSNTVRLHIARTWLDTDGSPRFETVEKRSLVTRLAEGVDARGILLPQAITRTRIALTEYNRALHAAGAVIGYATATSAVRDADNGEAFLGELEHSYGFRTELLSGEDEARTTFAGITSDAALRARVAAGTTMVLDIGGGSTETVIAQAGSIRDHHSFQLGSVRLTEQVIHSDPPTAAELDAAYARTRELLAGRFADVGPVDLAIGVAGTVTTAATLALGLAAYDSQQIHLSELTVAQVRAVLDRLAALSEVERAEVPGLEPKRAGVIVAGLTILVAVLDHFAGTSLLVSERDILDGIILRAAVMARDEDLTELPQPFGNAAC